MNIGSRIKKFRELKGLTQKQLAEKIGVTAVTITRYEKEDRKPDFVVLDSIATALGCTLMDLVGFNIKVEHGTDNQTSNAKEGFLSLCKYCGITVSLDPTEDGEVSQANIKYKDIDFTISGKDYEKLFSEVCTSIIKEVMNSQYYDFLD